MLLTVTVTYRGPTVKRHHSEKFITFLSILQDTRGEGEYTSQMPPQNSVRPCTTNVWLTEFHSPLTDITRQKIHDTGITNLQNITTTTKFRQIPLVSNNATNDIFELAGHFNL
jgi:hypothetical protein